MQKYLDAEMMMRYFGKADAPEITIRHVLTHTSEGSPGDEYSVLLSDYPSNKLNAAAGLISSVTDLARYDIAVDRHVFLKEASQAASWTAAVSKHGKTLPYGLG